VERFDRLLGRPGRIAQENWIEQAKILTRAGYAESEATRPVRLADAIRENAVRPAGEAPRPARAGVAALRSVRSEALVGETAAGGAHRPVGAFEDLKRIRGVGVLIEKKLNSLGVTTYEQVANWTGADIDRISQILDFKGRIERENWVEQARILAAGGQTEFSRRVDRGEVEGSRPVRP
jgi:predicted flap endonuclease-1-like 5' DNA nuclease